MMATSPLDQSTPTSDAPGLPGWRWQPLPPDLSASPGRLRRARLLVSSAVTVGVLTCGLAAARFVLEGGSSRVGWVLAAAALGFLGTPLVLRSSRSLTIAGSMPPLLGVLATGTMAFLEGGLYSEALFWAPFVPLVAALFVGARGAVAFGVAVALELVALAAAHLTGAAMSAAPADARDIGLRFFGCVGATAFGAALGWAYESGRLRAERELAATEGHNRALLKALPDLVFRLTADGRILEAPGSELGAENVGELLGDQEADRFIKQLEATLEGQRLQTGHFEIERGGRQRQCEVRTLPVERNLIVAIARDVTEQARVERAKDEFVSTVSHELRTPLTAIRGSLGLLSGGAAGRLPPETMNMLDVARRNSERLAQLVEDLLDIQKIEAGRMEFRLERVDLRDLFQETLELNQAMADRRGVTLVVSSEPPRAAVRADPARLQQALTNLLSNAVKHSPPGETVRVGARRILDGVRVTVTDQGPGIPPEFRERVFDKFFQIDSSTTRALGGTGLGLSITHNIVRRLAGQLDFTSVEGEGTTFYIDLPVVD